MQRNFEDGSDYEPFILEINGEWNFCKTARKPYDIVVNAVLQCAKEHSVVLSYSSDGDNQEEKAHELLESIK